MTVLHQFVKHREQLIPFGLHEVQENKEKKGGGRERGGSG